MNTHPMPAAIAALATDRRGYPVPYVALTSEPAPGPVGVQRRLAIPSLSSYLVHVGTEDSVYGQGTPTLGQVDGGRQLECHEHSKCNVCGQVIGARWLFTGGRSEKGPQNYTEAPLHRACLRWSLLTCPGLLGARSRDKLVVTMIDRADVAYLGSWADLHGFRYTSSFEAQAASEAAGGTPAVLLGLNALVGMGRTVPADQWLARNP